MRLLKLLLVLLVCASGPAIAAPPEGSVSGSLIQMKKEGGTYVVLSYPSSSTLRSRSTSRSIAVPLMSPFPKI